MKKKGFMTKFQSELLPCPTMEVVNPCMARFNEIVMRPFLQLKHMSSGPGNYLKH